MNARTRCPVGEVTRRWIETALGPGNRAGRISRLRGGTSSVTHAIRVQVRNGTTVDLVLRRWVFPGGERSHADYVERESRTLVALRKCGYLLGPELVAADSQGTESGGAPALLMTRLPGQVLLTPKDAKHWLRQMARELAIIHELPCEAPPYEPWFTRDDLFPKPWRIDTAAWAKAARIVAAGLPAEPAAFLHRDYQHFNLLWTRQRLSGVADSTEASRGPRSVDVAHCRWNLAVLFSPELAEEFRLAYEAESGHETDPRFDLAELMGHGPWVKTSIPDQVAGRCPVDIHGMDARVETLLRSVLARC